MHESHLEEHFRQWEHQQQTTITKLFDRNLSRWAKLTTNYQQSDCAWCCKNCCKKKDIKLLKTGVKILVNKCVCFSQSQNRNIYCKK